MLRIATINASLCPNQQATDQKPLTENLSDQQLDILCCRGIANTSDMDTSDIAVLARNLDMTCCFSATNQPSDGQQQPVPNHAGLAILTGQNTWMMYSGKVPLSGKSGNHGDMAQFAIIRKNGNAVLVINLQLDQRQHTQHLRQQQLATLFSHPIMGKQFAAILLFGNLYTSEKRKTSLSLLRRHTDYRVHDALAAGRYHQPENPGWGNIFILHTKKNPVAKVTIRKNHPLASRRTCPDGLADQQCGVALDLSLTRIKRDETSQLYRYASFTPRPGLVTMQGPQNVFFKSKSSLVSALKS